MQNRTTGPIALSLLLGMCATATSAAEKAKSKQSPDTTAAKVDERALRLKAASNIESVLAKLNVSAAEKAKVKTLTSESQWKQAMATFKTSRGVEIHGHAHKSVPKTIPSLMQKFMPSYMRSKIAASRRKARRGPPSRAEIAKIQKDARTKIQPVMRKTVMPALDKLASERVAELLQDEKTMTRVLADRMIKVEVLGEKGTRQFVEALARAGYPASLTTGEDPVLNERTAKMLKAIDLKQIVKAAGL